MLESLGYPCFFFELLFTVWPEVMVSIWTWHNCKAAHRGLPISLGVFPPYCGDKTPSAAHRMRSLFTNWMKNILSLLYKATGPACGFVVSERAKNSSAVCPIKHSNSKSKSGLVLRSEGVLKRRRHWAPSLRFVCLFDACGCVAYLDSILVFLRLLLDCLDSGWRLPQAQRLEQMAKERTHPVWRFDYHECVKEAHWGALERVYYQ